MVSRVSRGEGGIPYPPRYPTPLDALPLCLDILPPTWIPPLSRRDMEPAIPYPWKQYGTKDTLLLGPGTRDTEQTRASENITFPQLRWRAVTNTDD